MYSLEMDSHSPPGEALDGTGTVAGRHHSVNSHTHSPMGTGLPPTHESTGWNSHRNSFVEANFSGFVAVRIGETVLQVAELDLNSPSEESSSEEEEFEAGVSVV